jgi:prevent-host-death family protein
VFFRDKNRRKTMSVQVSIGRAKRDISKLVNLVANSGEHIILTSHGKPKAVIVSMEDYERLLKSESRATDIKKWLAKTRILSNKIEDRSGGPVDVDTIIGASRNDL